MSASSISKACAWPASGGRTEWLDWIAMIGRKPRNAPDGGGLVIFETAAEHALASILIYFAIAVWLVR